LRLFGAPRADIELFACDLEARGRARATITRRLCTLAGFYRYAVEEELIAHSPAAHVRRPRLAYESHAIGLGRNELGALLVAAGLGSPAEHALISLLALNGLRVSETTGAGIEALGVERGHRTLVITRKGGKVVTIPLAPPPPVRSLHLGSDAECSGSTLLARLSTAHTGCGDCTPSAASPASGQVAAATLAQVRELMPQRRNVGLGQVVADQAEVQVPALRTPVGAHDPRRDNVRTAGPDDPPSLQPIQARAHCPLRQAGVAD
jgi:hypothetical protein